MDENGEPIEGDDLKIYQHIEYEGGHLKLTEFIKDNFKYPKSERLLGTEGVVHVKFTVEKTGEVSNIELTGVENKAFRAEALRLAKRLHKWIPAKWHNRLIQSTYSIPLRFQIR